MVLFVSHGNVVLTCASVAVEYLVFVTITIIFLTSVLELNCFNEYLLGSVISIETVGLSLFFNNEKSRTLFLFFGERVLEKRGIERERER